MKIEENRILILDKDANFVEYKKQVGQMHQDCLDDFAKKNNYQRSDINTIVEHNNCVFYNVEFGMAVFYLPSKVTEEQSYQLDYLSNYMDGLYHMEGLKYIEGKENKFEKFMLEGNNIGEKFSKEVIQSYYEEKGKKK